MKLSFGFAASPGADRVARSIVPLAEYLRHTTGSPTFEIVVLDGFEQVAASLEQGEVAFGWLPPLTFARLAARVTSRLLLQSIRSDSASYHSALFARDDSPLHTLPELRGKRLAWVSQDSSSGYVLAARALAQAGIVPASETFFGSHAAVVAAVRSGSADAGATFCSLDLEARPHRIRSAGWTETIDVGTHRFRALGTFGAIPGDVLCAAPNTSYAQRALFVSAMARMHRDAAGLAILRGLFGADRFEIALPHHYFHLQQATMDLSAASGGRVHGQG